MSPAAAFARYRSAEITTLNQRDLIVKLYQGVERFVLQAAMNMEAGHFEASVQAAQKAKAIISELLATLDFERGGDISHQLQGLYVFFLSDITGAMVKKDNAELRKLIPIIANLRSAWEEIPDEIARGGGAAAGGHAVNIQH